MMINKEILDIEFMREELSTRNEHSFMEQTVEKKSNRCVSIETILNEYGIPYNIECFYLCGRYGYNIYVDIGNKDDNKCIVFNAHHDVYNINSENANDNTASIINLILLINKLKLETLNKRYLFVFTDGEEYGWHGVLPAINFINKNGMSIEFVINLELTGVGKTAWIEIASSHNKMNDFLERVMSEEFKSNKLICPFNDAAIYRNNGITAFTIGTINKIENNYDYSDWARCHLNEDNIMQYDDMISFVNKLYALFISKDKDYEQNKNK